MPNQIAAFRFVIKKHGGRVAKCEKYAKETEEAIFKALPSLEYSSASSPILQAMKISEASKDVSEIMPITLSSQTTFPSLSSTQKNS